MRTAAGGVVVGGPSHLLIVCSEPITHLSISCWWDAFPAEVCGSKVLVGVQVGKTVFRSIYIKRREMTSEM